MVIYNLFKYKGHTEWTGYVDYLSHVISHVLLYFDYKSTVFMFIREAQHIIVFITSREKSTKSRILCPSIDSEHYGNTVEIIACQCNSETSQLPREVLCTYLKGCLNGELFLQYRGIKAQSFRYPFGSEIHDRGSL